MEEEKRRWEHWEDLPEDMEKKLLERMARFFVGRDLGLMAQIILESGAPLSKMFSTMGMGLFGPYLEIIGMDTYVSFFRKEGNAKLLLNRIDELEFRKKKYEEELRKKELKKRKKRLMGLVG